jgi:squalene synthase HpnD
MSVQASGAQLTKASKSNLALSFISLPPEKREAMASLYGFCRVADDIVDAQDKSAEDKRREIAFWRREIDACYTGRPETPLGVEMARIINAFLIPPTPLMDILDGVEMDVEHRGFATFAELYSYCYRVASAVGLASINVFGYRDARTREYAVALGMAFQLTNILRDVRVDYEEYGRIYLPRDEMERHGVSGEDIRDRRMHEGCLGLFRLQYFRAEHYFHKAARLLPERDRPNMIAAEVMTEVYYSLLQKIRKKNFDVLNQTTRLNSLEKLAGIWRGRKGASINRRGLRPPAKIAVLGAGFAGISAALELARQGHQVEVLERKPYVGGRAHSFREAQTGAMLDNGQHIFMGCYHACNRLFDMLGVGGRLEKQGAMEVPYLQPGGGRIALKAGKAPAPFHLLSVLLGCGGFKWADRWAIARLGAEVRMGWKPKRSSTVAEWLQRSGQTPGAIRILWEPLCLAALNEPIGRADAGLFFQVLKESLMGGREASAIYISKVGLSELLMPEAGECLKAAGGALQIGEGVARVEWEGGRIASVETTKGRKVAAETFISAVPWNVLASWLPEDHACKRGIGGIEGAPIISVHLFCDRELLAEPFAGFLDSPVQWVFNRTQALPDSELGKCYYYVVVISAAYEWMNRGTGDILEMIRTEFGKFFPNARGVVFRHHVMFKAKDATFAARPETELLRPKPSGLGGNVVVAGDWSATGLPATLEGAARSGFEAARLVG